MDFMRRESKMRRTSLVHLYTVSIGADSQRQQHTMDEQDKPRISAQKASHPFDIYSLGSYAKDKQFVLHVMERCFSPGGNVKPWQMELAQMLLFRLVMLGEWGRS
jgi:hypothetical protein